MKFTIRYGAAVAAILALAACSSGDDVETTDAAATESSEIISSESESTVSEEPGDPDEQSFRIDVWADNWMAVYVDGELVGEDSVSITTERSFNAESFTFDATYPFTLSIEAKDFKETDSGLEYIGENNQQMGDGGLIAQVTNTATSEVVAVSDGSWSAMVVHRAPLNTDCERDTDPDATCEYEIIDTPDGWTGSDSDDAGWSTATEWSEDAVSPKDGYDQIDWDPSAQLIWGSDLEVDNTVLLRTTVG